MSDDVKQTKSKFAGFSEAVKWIAEICCDLEGMEEFSVRAREGGKFLEVRVYLGEQRALVSFARESAEVQSKEYMRLAIERLWKNVVAANRIAEASG